MSQQGTETVLNDRSVLEGLGLTEANAAALLNKTRQAINIGIRQQQAAELKSGGDRTRKSYFKGHEWLYLAAHYQMRTGQPVPKHIVEYMAHAADSGDTSALVSALGFASGSTSVAEPIVRNAETVVAVIPDVGHFLSYGGAAVSLVFDVALKNGRNFSLFTKDGAQRDAFVDGLICRRYADGVKRGAKDLLGEDEPKLNGYFHLLLLNPDHPDSRKRRVFMAAREGRLVEIDSFEVPHVISFVRRTANGNKPFFAEPVVSRQGGAPGKKPAQARADGTVRSQP